VIPRINVLAVVDVVAALSRRSLRDQSLCLMDDSTLSTGQGTPDLCTACRPGQLIKWSAFAVDVQTPVEIRAITFLPTPQHLRLPGSPPALEPGTAQEPDGDARAGLQVWEGIVPPWLIPGTAYHYRLELQMDDGPDSTLHLDTPALRYPV
jgi:hypothetical protein